MKGMQLLLSLEKKGKIYELKLLNNHEKIGRVLNSENCAF